MELTRGTRDHAGASILAASHLVSRIDACTALQQQRCDVRLPESSSHAQRRPALLHRVITRTEEARSAWTSVELAAFKLYM